MTAEEIRKRRKEAGLTQNELGKRVGISGSHICNIEKGKQPASKEVLDKIQKALAEKTIAVIAEQEDEEEWPRRRTIWVFGLPEKR